MSYNFDAVNDYLYTNTLPVSAYGFTVAMWVKRHNFGDVTNCGFAMGVANTANPQFNIKFDPSGTPMVVAVSDDGTVTRSEYATADVTQNAWSHTAAVWTANNSRTIYANGGNAVTEALLCSATFTSMNQMRLGVNMTTAQDFDGQIAHVAIWNTALTAQNIADLASGDNPLAIQSGNLVAYWPLTADLDDVVGTNNLTISGNTNLVTPADNPSVDPPPASNPTISSTPSELNIGFRATLTGTNFEATQGTGNVYISPTDSSADPNKVTQTINSWSDTGITFTVSRGALNYDTNLYLFVKNNSGDFNSSGSVTQIKPGITLVRSV